MVPEFFQVGIAREPFEVAVAVVEGVVERGGGLTGLVEERVAAGEVVLHERIVGAEAGEPLVHLEAGLEAAAPGVIIAEHLERLEVFGVAPDDAFEEADGDVQLALFVGGQFFLGAALVWHGAGNFGEAKIQVKFVLAEVFCQHGGAMNCFVTGASGFIGANLVRELIARGHRVKVLVRAGSDLRGIEGLDCERVIGDLGDGPKLAAALRGCDWCFHVAAIYHLWMRDYSPMYAANVAGTRNVLEAAAQAGCTRIVYTSTVGCIGLPQPLPDGRIIPSDEATPVSEAQMSNHYQRSKWQAEQVAVELARRGLPVVIVNPSGPIGPLDVKPTPTGRLIVDFLNRKLPAYIDTGLNWVPVRDVAIGHILAAEHGRIGQRYILGHAAGNWTLRQTLDVLAEISGVPAPTRQIPRGLALALACANEAVSFVTGIPPKVPLAGARMSGHKMWFSPAKAIHELGLPQPPLRQAFAEAVEWFYVNGYAKP